MKQINRLPKLPKKILVEIKKADSGDFLAYIPEFDIFTEADNPAHLILQVNDLIYAYFDVPKKYQAQLHFFPPLEVLEDLWGIREVKLPKVQFSSFYTPNSHLLQCV
ncbi:MAG: hypothetical protein A2172_04590 [Candidatus Woykebacteria bacterium RBG_13_40_15]|uniref:Uncharacterized protein n=1 Tax=Candidatus Woykebacteria bacterium RBG_13_40_15 TaxID=1802593 RepID=A0A1G1W7Z1_9BACT|nr:MAG: hypothetical protein A2172_04590 [Candidatus Woykebacteria bacterium RBG_13_40_15]